MYTYFLHTSSGRAAPVYLKNFVGTGHEGDTRLKNSALEKGKKIKKRRNEGHRHAARITPVKLQL